MKHFILAAWALIVLPGCNGQDSSPQPVNTPLANQSNPQSPATPPQPNQNPPASAPPTQRKGNDVSVEPDRNNVPGCVVGQLRETSHVPASEINGGNTGAFVRETTCPGYKSISARVTLPVYQTQPAQTDQPWIYFGMNDGRTDIELGFAFEMGTPTLNPPPRWLPYVRKGSVFKYGKTIVPGSTVDVRAYYAQEAGHLSVNSGEDVLSIAVAFNVDKVQVRRVVGIAVRDEDFEGNHYPKLSLKDVIWENTLVISNDGKTSEFKNVPLEARYENGHWYGTVWWPSERISYERGNGQDSISILSEPISPFKH